MFAFCPPVSNLNLAALAPLRSSHGVRLLYITRGSSSISRFPSPSTWCPCLCWRSVRHMVLRIAPGTCRPWAIRSHLCSKALALCPSILYPPLSPRHALLYIGSSLHPLVSLCFWNIATFSSKPPSTTHQSVRRGVPAVHQDRGGHRLHGPDDGRRDPSLLWIPRGRVLRRPRGAYGRGRGRAAAGVCVLEALALTGSTPCMSWYFLVDVVVLTAWGSWFWWCSRM